MESEKIYDTFINTARQKSDAKLLVWMKVIVIHAIASMGNVEIDPRRDAWYRRNRNFTILDVEREPSHVEVTSHGECILNTPDDRSWRCRYIDS